MLNMTFSLWIIFDNFTVWVLCENFRHIYFHSRPQIGQNQNTGHFFDTCNRQAHFWRAEFFILNYWHLEWLAKLTNIYPWHKYLLLLYKVHVVPLCLWYAWNVCDVWCEAMMMLWVEQLLVICFSILTHVKYSPKVLRKVAWGIFQSTTNIIWWGLSSLLVACD